VDRVRAPVEAVTAMFFSSTRLSFTSGMRPLAKPITSNRPFHAMHLSDRSVVSPPTEIVDHVGALAAGRLLHRVTQSSFR
jgi:hypothetical protein